MSNRHGFTLIELLVVICIICILAALALPAANRVRQTSAQVSCLSNIRQITAGAMLYASDNGGQLPYCNWGDPGNGGVYQFGWLFVGPNYRTKYPAISFGGAHYATNTVMTGSIWPYVNNLQVYHCPLDQQEFYVGTNWMTSYLCNGSQCGYGAVAQSSNSGLGASLRQIKSPGQSVMFWEAQEQLYQNQSLTGAVWNDGSSYPSEEVLAARHFKGANVSCYDSHAEWWDPGTWQINVSPTSAYSPTGFTRLWCSPYSGNGH
jgi:prepilin-type N-terminal cleavage/methylation domain-containing protein